ncbi:MAG: metallophosphoesterase [Tannerella sp.]|jgi:predicted phosphodiesterase|nr:metallophosphoesterase [Tannerella sp.]
MKQLLSLFLLLFTGLLSAQIQITHGPYLCDMTATGVSIVWMTDKPAVSWVELAPDGSDHFYAQERPKFFDTSHGRKRANDTIHHVRLENLESGKTYRYRIVSQEVTDWKTYDYVLYGRMASTAVYGREPLKFTTFDNNRKEINFLILNDIHGRASFMKELCQNIDFKALDFVVLNGDMSDQVESQEQLCRGYIDTLVSMFASEVPLVYARGNHETRGVYSDMVMRYFPTVSGQFYYQFNIGKTAFLVLDGGEDKPDSDIEYCGIADYDRYREQEAEWLKKTIQSPDYKDAEAHIVFLHIPPTVGNWHANVHLQETLLPVLNAANVDIMFSGHTHRYSYNEPNERAKFPILVNSNTAYVLCKLKDNRLSMEVKGIDPKNDRKQEIGL